jgi:hypothetical protein
LSYAHSVLGLGCAAIRGIRRCHSILIPAGDGSVASIRVDGSFGPIGALGYAHSILGLGFSAVGGLSGRYPIRILVGDGSVARVRVDSSGILTIPTNGLTAQVFDAILLRKHT